MLALRAGARAGLVTGLRTRAALPRQKMEWLFGTSAARPPADVRTPRRTRGTWPDTAAPPPGRRARPHGDLSALPGLSCC